MDDDCSTRLRRLAIRFPSEYIDSFEVAESNCRKTRIKYVRKQLETIRELLWRNDPSFDFKSVVLIISLAGIKMCSLDGKTVHMAHELKRVSYATCDPGFCLFAFVAREPNVAAADIRSRQYCHVFKTDSPEQAEEINSIFGSAFRAALIEKSSRSNDHSVIPTEEIVDNVEEVLQNNNNDKFLYNENLPNETTTSPPVLVNTIDDNQREEQIVFVEQEEEERRKSKLSSLYDENNFENNVDHGRPPIPPSTGVNKMNSSSTRGVADEEREQVRISVDNNHRHASMRLSMEKLPIYDSSPVKLRPKNNPINKDQPQLKENNNQQQERKRRPLSAAFMLLSKKEKRKVSHNNNNNNNNVNCSPGRTNNDVECTWNNDERHLLTDSVSSTTELIKRGSSHRSVNGSSGGSIFKRLFGGSTWRLNSSSSSSGDQNNDALLKTEKLLTSGSGTKKRRPLSAVFVGAGIRGGEERKHNSILNLRSAADSVTPLSSTGRSALSAHGGSLKETNDRKARSVVNLESVARRSADSPGRHSIVGGPASSFRSSQHHLGGCVPRASQDSECDYLVPLLTLDEEKKLHSAAWFVDDDRGHKDAILNVLTLEPIGSFVVRRSSQPCCLALTVRVPFSHNPSGISHFLILQTTRGFKLKGFSKAFPSVHALVTHHSIMPEQLPCRLMFVHREPDAFLRKQQQLINTNDDVDDIFVAMVDGKRSVGTTMEKSDDEDDHESIYGMTTFVRPAAPNHSPKTSSSSCV